MSGRNKLSVEAQILANQLTLNDRPVEAKSLLVAIQTQQGLANHVAGAKFLLSRIVSKQSPRGDGALLDVEALLLCRAELYALFDRMHELKRRTRSIECCGGFLHNEGVEWHENLLTLAIKWTAAFGDDELEAYLRDRSIVQSWGGPDINDAPCAGEFDRRLGIGRRLAEGTASDAGSLQDVRKCWKPTDAPAAASQRNTSRLLSSASGWCEAAQRALSDLRCYNAMFANMQQFLYTKPSG